MKERSKKKRPILDMGRFFFRHQRFAVLLADLAEPFSRTADRCTVCLTRDVEATRLGLAFA